jgi:Xaa-Pro dipeptidase
MPATASKARIQRLAQVLQDNGIDAFFANTPISMGYLAGFKEYGHERFMALAINTQGQVALICPALSAEQAKKSGIEDIRPWPDGEDPLALFQALAVEWNLRSSILAVDDEMSARQLLEMQSVLPAALFKPGQPVIGNLMRKKDDQELATMLKAAEIADQALAAGHKAVRPGATEAEVSDALSNEMRRLGGKPTFAIIGAGQNGAEPHHLTDDTVIKEGDVIILDFGCDVDGYQSDITRCASCGPASDEAQKIYKIVLDAHNAARAKIHPGVTPEAIDQAARQVIEQAGYGEFFMHRTGHGIGMQGHEAPFIVQGNTTPLEPGECFSIEPGIYLPGKFGIRIENIVTVTPEGHRSLNEEPAPTLTELKL